MQGKEILEEIKSVISGKTLDAVLPPLVFVFAHQSLGLNTALILSLGLAVLLAVIRFLHKQTWKYALGGLGGVVLASGLVYLTRDAANYFIGSLISSAFLFLIALVSLLIGKPLAIWASHLSRGWSLDWYWRKDIKPAYIEVTWFWTAFILIRLFIQLMLFLRGDIFTLAWANIVLGWPMTLVVLIISYIYGIWRLHRLGGPGIEEFKAEKGPPWKGQTRGF